MRGLRREQLAAGRTIVSACALVAAAVLAAAARDAASGAQATQPPQYEMPAAATFDPDRVEFGKQVAGWWSRAQRVVVTNTGGAPLFVKSVTVGGEAPDRFSIVSDTCTGSEVVPYRACVIDITFGPSGPSGFAAELTVMSNTLDSPQTVRLRGEGVNSANVPPGGFPPRR